MITICVAESSIMMLVFGILLAFITITKGEEANDNLPLCPINIQYFPQSLPMHCKMPFKAINNSFPQMAAPFYPQPHMSSMPGMGSPQMYQSGIASPQIAQIVNPSQSGGYPYAAMQVPQMPMMPMPGMPMSLPQKPPMVVMPYYAPQQKADKKKKKQHKKPQKPYPVRFYDTIELPLDREPALDKIPKDSSEIIDLYDSLDMGDEFDFDFRRRKSTKRRNNKGHNQQKFSKVKKGNLRRFDPLTPVLQYVSKDGYIIYEKELSQNEAHDYLTEKPTATTKHVVEERFAPVKNTRRQEQESLSNEDTYDDLYHDLEDKMRSQTSGKDRKNHKANGEEKGRNKKSNIKERSRRRNQKDLDGTPL